jgi:hypothetical protein
MKGSNVVVVLYQKELIESRRRPLPVVELVLELYVDGYPDRPMKLKEVGN